jgi:glycerol-3-phosphate acyltransferase PlsY
MTLMYMAILFIISYLLGSIPFGLILGKVIKGIDIRKEGSGNTGATNAVRVLGFKIGIWAFVFDFLKGGIVMAFMWIFRLEQFYIIGTFNIEILYGLVAIIGHVYPVYIKFKGGKAMATTAGMLTFLEPQLAVIVVIIFIVVFLKQRIVSVASLSAAGSAVLLMLLRPILFSLLPQVFIHTSKNLNTFALESFVVVILGILIVFRHMSNLRKLGEGKEFKFIKKGK